MSWPLRYHSITFAKGIETAAAPSFRSVGRRGCCGEGGTQNRTHAQDHILVKLKHQACSVGTTARAVGGGSGLWVVPLGEGVDVETALAEYNKRPGEVAVTPGACQHRPHLATLLSAPGFSHCLQACRFRCGAACVRWEGGVLRCKPAVVRLAAPPCLPVQMWSMQCPTISCSQTASRLTPSLQASGTWARLALPAPGHRLWARGMSPCASWTVGLTTCEPSCSCLHACCITLRPTLVHLSLAVLLKSCWSAAGRALMSASPPPAAL